jgi:hypothetical protein
MCKFKDSQSISQNQKQKGKEFIVFWCKFKSEVSSTLFSIDMNAWTWRLLLVARRSSDDETRNLTVRRFAWFTSCHTSWHSLVFRLLAKKKKKPQLLMIKRDIEKNFILRNSPLSWRRSLNPEWSINLEIENWIIIPVVYLHISVST